MLDTNVWLDGLVFADARVATLFAALRDGRLVVLSNAACREEWRRVLRYPVLGLACERCDALERAYDALSLEFEAPRSTAVTPLPRCKDKDDQKFLELARDGSVVALLSRDVELLRLSRRCERGFGFVVKRPEEWVGEKEAWLAG